MLSLVMLEYIGNERLVGTGLHDAASLRSLSMMV